MQNALNQSCSLFEILANRDSLEFFMGFCIGLCVGVLFGFIAWYLAQKNNKNALEALKIQNQSLQKDKEMCVREIEFLKSYHKEQVQTLKDEHSDSLERLNKNFYEVLRGVVK